MAKDYLTSYMKERAGLSSNRQAEECYEAILEGLVTGITKDGRVMLRQFGAFHVRARAARTGRNPSTGEAIAIPARKAVVFSPGEDLRRAAEAMDKGEAASWLESREIVRRAAKEFEALKNSVVRYSKEPERLGREARETISHGRDQLSELVEKARYKLDLLQRGSGDAFAELRKGFEAAYAELKKAVNRAGKKL